MKRQRGRGRKPGGGGHQNPNKAYDSQGPDVRVRGSAQTIFEKYQTLARDSLSAGDRILAENYLQHAEHYLRLLKSMQPGFVPRADLMVSGYAGEGELGWDEDEDGDEDLQGDGGYGGQQTGGQQGGGQGNGYGQQRREFQQRDYQQRDGREPRDAREPREPREPRDGAEGDADGDRRFGRNRRRRDRFRNGFEGERPGYGADGADRPERADRSERSERSGGERPAPAGVASDPLAVQGFDDQPAAPTVELGGFVPAAGQEGAERPARRPRPPRPPREPREPREAAPGFGSDVPSFLAAAPALPPEAASDA
jgi:hypothetical protein